MQITLQETNALERRMTIAVPASRVEEQIKERLNSLAKTAKVSGFRPGKVPLSYMEQRYGNQVRQEVVEELTNSTFYEAISKEQLRPVGAPKIEERRAEPGSDLEYTAVFEVYPVVQLNTLEGFTLDKPVPQISDQDIDAMIERMRQQKPRFRAVDRPAREGDQLMVDLGRDDGQPGEGHKIPVVIGSKTVMEEFENALVGISPGEEKTVEVDFPSDYRDPQYAGRTVVFHVKADEVAEPSVPEVDEEFARDFGVAEGGVEALRREVAQGMQREAEEASREIVKRRILRQLQEANPVELPRGLVDEELQRLTAEAQQQGLPQAGQGDAVSENGALEQKARERVSLGLMMAEIVKQQNLQVKPEALRAKVEALAATYDEPNKVVEWYYADRRRLQQLESLVLEEEVVNWLLGQAQLRDQPMSYEELMSSRQEAG